MYSPIIELFPEGEVRPTPSDPTTAYGVGHVVLQYITGCHYEGARGDGALTDRESTWAILDAISPRPPQGLYFAEKTPAQIAREQLNAENARKEAERRLAEQERRRKQIAADIAAQDQRQAGK
ncbi:MAG: hypothetical protein AAB834_01190 [Patescibacteria group bacterium]